MDEFFDALWFNKPFTLSYDDDGGPPVVVSKDVLKHCAWHDMFALDFLYNRHKRQFNGVILNCVEDMYPQLQISTFLGALNNALKTNFLVLVLCPDDEVVKWHYYITTCGVFDIKIITSRNNIGKINEGSGTVFLLSFSNMKLLETMTDCVFYSVVIDHFDEVATKMVIRKLQCKFKIGVTLRNFYTNPDQKIVWTMLNWANPGSVGKLADFYETDNDNFANFRNSYTEWWFRITWEYCENFKKPTLKQKGELNTKLRQWEKLYNLSSHCIVKGRKKKGKVEIVEGDQSEDDNKAKKSKNNNGDYKEPEALLEPSKNNNEISASDNSDDTIIYEESKTNCDITNVDNSDDVESVSSGEQILLALVGDDNVEPKYKKRPSSHLKSQAVPEDESDLFLKSFASQINTKLIEDSQEEFLSKLLKDGKDERTNISQIELNLAEEKILGDHDTAAESDKFLKEICSDRKQCGNTEKNECLSRNSDVDQLVAEVMEMVQK